MMGPQFNVKGTEEVGRQASHLKGQKQSVRLIKSVTDPRSRCSPLRTQYPRGSCWRKGKLLLIRQQSREKADLCSHEPFKGKGGSHLS